MALKVTAGLGIAYYVFSIVLVLAGVALAANPFADRPQMMDQTTRVVMILVMFLIMGWWLLVLLAAVQMKGLRSFGFAMTGAILAMIPCNVCCLLGLPFGIWALVVLNRPDVKSAFVS